MDILEKHKCTHTGERQYACDEPDCKYRAARASNLKAHKRTQRGERPYACDEPDCEYSAPWAKNRMVHKRMHIDKADQAVTSAAHKLTHCVERPYVTIGCKYRAALATGAEKLVAWDLRHIWL
ncbi:hypothetical protein T492DRAFT_853421 [Pavlovales sp. CCMP2436]|nr:hypothetical protein T492DRAFT_853421 [Pavlovales sp. CCMP2436]